MYNFHCNFIKNNFDVEWLFTDTESLTYEIKSENVCSNYSKDSNFFDETNIKLIGKMKDEFREVIVTEFVGLKSKMYSMKKLYGKECNAAKGIIILLQA